MMKNQETKAQHCSMTPVVLCMNDLNAVSQNLLAIFIEDTLHGFNPAKVEQANKHLRKAFEILKTHNDERTGSTDV